MQKYTDIPSSKTLAESLSLILNNDKTALTCQAGTAFPTVDVREGMLCYRIDHKKLYQCAEVLPDTTWRVVADLSGNARLLDGGTGNTINYDKRNLNSWDDMPTGFYQGSNMLNAPTGDTAWRVIQIREGNSSGYSSQLAFGVNSDKIYTRNQRGGMWTDWLEVWTGKKGKVVPGLNADRVDDLEPSNVAGQIPINNGTVNQKLNADMVDGYHAGNGPNQLALNNSVLNAGLNADTVDGFHAGNESGNVSINNGKLNKNLNAEFIGGVKVDGLLQVDSSGAIPRKLQQINVNYADINSANIKNFIQRRYSGSTQPLKEFKVSSEKGGRYDSNHSDNCGGDFHEFYAVDRIDSGIAAGDYSLYQIIQLLINNSHRHTAHSYSRSWNCNCQCMCDSDAGCFVSGKLLTTRGYVEVSELRVGDELISSTDNTKHKILGIAKSTVGNRKVVKLDDSVVTDEHVVFIDGEPKVFTDRPLVSAILEAENGVKGMYEIPEGTSKFNAWLVCEVDPNTPTYSPICEKGILVDMDGYEVLVAGKVNA